jgi:ketosteroid isomerase-like protein
VSATTDDIVALDQLQSRYVTFVDARRFDDLVDLFTDDVVIDASSVIGEVWRGKEDARAHYARRASPHGAAHFTANGVIDVQGDTATGTRYLLSSRWNIGQGADHVFFGTLGMYSFAFRKVDGAWLISRVEVRSVFGEQRNIFAEPAGE